VKTVENAAKLGGVTLRTATCSVYTQVWRNYPLRLGCLLNGEHSAASLFAVPLVFCGFAVVHLLASSDGFLDFSDDFLRLPFRHCLSSVCPIRLERMAGLQTIGKGA
jgi:hypothetical protein